MKNLAESTLLTFLLFLVAAALLLIRYWVTGKIMERKSCSGAGSKLCSKDLKNGSCKSSCNCEK